MRFIAWAIAMITGLLALEEMVWRNAHIAVQQDAWSSDGSMVAEVRLLPEGSPHAPYGIGVFLRPGWLPMNALGADLAFAGYCASIHTHWPAKDQVQIHCELTGQDEPY